MVTYSCESGDVLATHPEHNVQYGSGATNMAATNGIDKSVAVQFIKNYYSRYPNVKKWQDEIASHVDSNRILTEGHTKKGYPKHIAHWTSETGRRYTFTTSDAPEFMDKKTSFKPTEVKNYPVQGTATGDIVPMMLGVVYQWLIRSEWWGRVLLINTVHDSMVFDARLLPEQMKVFAADLKQIMERAPTYYEEKFGVKFTLPLKVEVSVGENWKDQEVI